MAERMGIVAGKTALVIGASRGIGAATATRLAAEGAAVVLAGRNLAALEAVKRSIAASGAIAHVIAMDMADHASLQKAVEFTIECQGRLDIAVNNAGISQPRDHFHRLAPGIIDQTILINLRGLIVAMQAEIRAMLTAGGGSIVNVGSIASHIGTAQLAAYTASKHGVYGVTRSVAREYAARNIRVNMVAPGAIMTDMLVNAGAVATAEARAKVESAIPMGRIGEPEEIAGVIAWVCSNAGSYMTGASIPVDGGMMA